MRAAVAGFDLVFSPVKSAALLWALDDRPRVREAIRAAHQQAMRTALDLLEEHAAYTRTGTGGIAQMPTRGLIAAEFEHWDSRAGDPNLHTHVAISSKVQGVDGTWRSLDARGLYRMTVAASECYNTAFEAALTESLGITFTPRPDTTGNREPVREITGVPFGMIEFFSRRRAAIEARYAQLIRHYRREHGRDPSSAVCHQLARQANLDTRQGKKPPRSLADKRAAWREELIVRFGPRGLTRLAKAVPATAPEPAALQHPPELDLQNLAERTVAAVAARRSTWTVWNLRAEAERLLRTTVLTPPPDRHREVVEQVMTLAVSPAFSVSVEAPAMLDEPPELRRGDGESVFHDHAAHRYTSQSVLDAERRLLEATRTPAAGAVSSLAASAALDGYEAVTGTRLDAGQRNLVTSFATDDRLLLAGIGPAGTGKTTAMRAYAHVLRRDGRRLVPLATSATSADVLGRELSLPAENLHKFLHEWTSGPAADRLRAGAPIPGAVRSFALHPGDVVLVDEAGMAGTFLLDRLVAIAASQGAIVRLVGDDRQLSAVESGGALRLIAAQPGTPELSTLHRFRDPAEAEATLQLRAGDSAAVDWYARSGRVRSGSREWMAQAAYAGWKTDMLAGKTTLMAAGDGADVAELAAQARADRVAAGQVEAEGVVLRDGNLAGAGDWIVTRLNDRRLSVHGGRDWVKNGDAWQVRRRHGDGSLTVVHTGHGGRVRLPAAYVRAQVQLLYAATAHRVQGVTVDTAHPLITRGMTREILYVLASRARERTTFYVATYDLPFDEDARVDRVRTDPRSYAAREVLLNIVATEGAALSATETIAVTQELAGSLATLVPRYLHAAHQHADSRYRDAAAAVFGADGGSSLAADPAWGAVVRRLYDAENVGWEPARLLETARNMRELHSAESVAEVLSWRIDAILSNTPGPPRRNGRVETGAAARERLERAAVGVLGRLADQACSEAAWPALISALRRAEGQGLEPVALLAATIRGRELRTARSVSEVLAWRIARYLAGVAAGPPGEVAAAASDPVGPTPLAGLPPWVQAQPPAAETDGAGPLTGYLTDAAALITARVSELADASIRERPVWMNMLGQQPADPRVAGQWHQHVAVIAAYRDQYQVSGSDPRQVLGPYAEPGHAGHNAYWQAAESVLTARRLAGLDHSVPGRRKADAGIAQVAADIYRALPQDQRAAIAADVAAKAGVLWLGDRSQPDEVAAAHPAYASQLMRALAERSHLTERGDVSTGNQAVIEDKPLEAELARRGRHRRSERDAGGARLGPRLGPLPSGRPEQRICAPARNDLPRTHAPRQSN
jgi:conjugative relaxase-like TrwC/TraI family protein